MKDQDLLDLSGKPKRKCSFDKISAKKQSLELRNSLKAKLQTWLNQKQSGSRRAALGIPQKVRTSKTPQFISASPRFVSPRVLSVLNNPL